MRLDVREPVGLCLAVGFHFALRLCRTGHRSFGVGFGFTEHVGIAEPGLDDGDGSLQ